MLRAAVLGALAPLSGCAPDLPLLCGREEVIRIVDRTVRGWNAYNRILADTAAEAPTTAADSVVCHATMATIGYERMPEGWVARPVQEVRRYDVQIVRNRLFVQVPP